jgi:hypothetical protein
VYSPDAWGELDLVDRVTGERVRGFLTAWPDAMAVEVRACACGHKIARRVHQGDEPQAEVRR